MQHQHLVALAAWVAFSACASLPSGPLSTMAQRTTATSDTATTAVGSLEIELGSVDESGPSLEVPLAVKLGLGSATEAFIEGAAFQRTRREGGGASEGPGDLGIGLRHRPIDESATRPSVAFDLFVKFPTGDETRGLGSGELDLQASVFAMKDLGRPTLFARAQLAALGHPDDSFDLEPLFALAIAMPHDEALSTFAELSPVWQPEADTEQLNATLGLAWTSSESTLLEAGLRTDLLGNSDSAQLLVGFTWNLGTIF